MLGRCSASRVPHSEAASAARRPKPWLSEEERGRPQSSPALLRRGCEEAAVGHSGADTGRGWDPALPSSRMTPGAVWVQVGPPPCPIQASPAPLCPSLGLLPLCTMNRPIVPAVPAPPPFIIDWNQPTFPRLPAPSNPRWGDRGNGLCLALPSYLSAQAPPHMGYFCITPHDL